MKWSIKGFSYPSHSGTVENLYADDISPEWLAGERPEQPSFRWKSGKDLTAEQQAAYRIQLQTQEPFRALVAIKDERTGRTQYAWIYLEDYGTKWSEVDWDEVSADFAKQYNIEVPPPKPPEPKPEPRKQAPIPPKQPPKKKNIWNRITDDIREIFLGQGKPKATPTPQPQPPTKKSVWDKVPAPIRRLFGKR